MKKFKVFLNNSYYYLTDSDDINKEKETLAKYLKEIIKRNEDTSIYSFNALSLEFKKEDIDHQALRFRNHVFFIRIFKVGINHYNFQEFSETDQGWNDTFNGALYNIDSLIHAIFIWINDIMGDDE